MHKSTALIEACRVGLVAMALAWNAGCGGGTSASAGDAGADTGDVAGDAGNDTGATPADGGGVCCEYSTSCSCLGGGGWAASASACVPASSSCAADGQWHFETDSHGCQSVVTGTGPNCCGCGPLDSGDSGDAGSADAAVDSSCPANFCACTCQDGGAGYRPQCDLVHCTSTDPCISGLAADGGWLLCGI